MEHFKVVTDEITKKQEIMGESYKKLKQEDNENKVKAALFNFLERNSTIQTWKQHKLVHDSLNNTKQIEDSAVNTNNQTAVKQN